MRATVIEVRGLVNRFGSQTVHEDLDLDLYRGEVLGVVGGSGTGKSVLLRSIVGLRRPNAGDIRVLGEQLERQSPEARSRLERRLGVLYQRGALFTSLTVLENTALPLIEHSGLKRPEAERLADIVKTNTDTATRKQAVIDIQKSWIDDSLFVPIYSDIFIMASRKTVTGLGWIPNTVVRLEDVSK